MCGGTAVDRQSDRVHVNDIAAAYEGTRYLLDLGHRSILFLSDDERKDWRGISARSQVAAGLWRNRDWFFQKNRYCAVALLSAMAMTPCGARCQRDSALQQFLHQ